jgi:hypothetical protein
LIPHGVGNYTVVLEFRDLVQVRREVILLIQAEVGGAILVLYHTDVQPNIRQFVLWSQEIGFCNFEFVSQILVECSRGLGGATTNNVINDRSKLHLGDRVDESTRVVVALDETLGE